MLQIIKGPMPEKMSAENPLADEEPGP